MRWNVAMAALAASWGLVAVLVAAVDLGSVPLAFFRLVLAAGFLAVLALAAGRRRLLHPAGRLPQLALLGAVQAAHWLLFFEATKRGSVALAVVTFYAAPIAIALVAPLVLPDRTTPAVAVAVGVGAIGVALVSLGGGEDGGPVTVVALACGLGSAATYAVLVLLARRLLLAEVPAITVAFWDCAVGAMVVAPLLIGAGRVLPDGGGEWAAVALLGVILTGVSTLVYASLLRHVTAQVAGLLTFLEPVAGITLAALLLGQQLGVAAVAGATLVLAAGAVAVGWGPVGAGAADAPAGVGSRPP